MKNWFLLVSLSIILSSCSKEPVDFKKEIVGKWETPSKDYFLAFSNEGFFGNEGITEPAHIYDKKYTFVQDSLIRCDYKFIFSTYRSDRSFSIKINSYNEEKKELVVHIKDFYKDKDYDLTFNKISDTIEDSNWG